MKFNDFEKAQELNNKINDVSRFKNLLTNSFGNNILVKHENDKSTINEIYHNDDELQKLLINTVDNYYKKLQKEFEEL